jgi:hypothetical protein
MSFASQVVARLEVPDSQPATHFPLEKASARPLRASRTRTFIFKPAFAVLLVAFAVGGIWYYTHPSNSPWEVVRLDGAPVIDSRTVGETDRLAEGQWLETDSYSRARVNVGSIGEVDVEPNTRIQLVETQFTEHRLSLERGRLQANIWAPPRLFFVNTPSAEAVDLGCKYTLEVDDTGRGLLHVTAGWVAFVLDGRESKVPAGAMCETRPAIGPGTPYFEDAPETVREGLTKLDFEGGRDEALNLVLLGARTRDTLTLYHLLSRVEEEKRGAVYDKLAQFNMPPSGVTREGVLHLNGEMLDMWREQLEPTWLKESMPTLRKVWRWIWS